MKIQIVSDELYPYYYIVENSKLGIEVDIPEAQLDWIKESLRASIEVREYLAAKYEAAFRKEEPEVFCVPYTG